MKNQVVDKYSDFGKIKCENTLLIQIHHKLLNITTQEKIKIVDLLASCSDYTQKIAAAITIQAWYRQKLQLIHAKEDLFAEIIHSRAGLYIQRWWRWNNLRMRLKVLEEIKKHCQKIQSNTLYLEESLYLYVNEKLVNAEKPKQKQLMEQKAQFGFSDGKTLTWYDSNNFGRYNFEDYAAPKWLNIPLI